ncbi:MAG TPA: hypothetical protein VIQ74_09515 [Gemmatimonadaceae bacterium]
MRTSNITVALATCADWPALNDDDRLLVPALAARGVSAVPRMWDDPVVDWSAYDAVVIRSCWDYYLRHAEFLAWVGRLEAAEVRVWNPPALLRWNADKTYLRGIAERGVPVIPTEWVEMGESASLAEILSDAGWTGAVVKPVVSAAAHDTWRVSRASAAADDVRFHALTARGGVLVQPFIDAVTTEGEWSLLFFGGEYSHAVLKHPRNGDFRVQPQHGGTADLREPPEGIVDQARAALRAAHPAAADALYARVDGCVLEDGLHIMELELLEPFLFLGAERGAPDRLAAALVARLGGA